MGLKVGNRAPDVLLSYVDGKQVQLSEYWGNGRSTLLIFLRHLG